MTAAEIIEELKEVDPTYEVMVFFKTKEGGHLEHIESLCMNGEGVQLNSESTNEERNENGPTN